MDTGTIIIAVATVVTGIATCVSAFVTWRSWRGRLSVDWGRSWTLSNHKRTLNIDVTVHNDTSSTVDIATIEILDPSATIIQGGRYKDASWAPNIVPIHTEVPPRTSAKAAVQVALDWRVLASSKSRLMSSKRTTKLRVQTTLASRSSRRRQRKFRSHIPIAREMINDMANPSAT